MFEKSKSYFIIEIDGKRILYKDKLQGELWGGSLQYLPPDPSVKMKIITSRNRIPAWFIDLFTISPNELKEFEDAKDENELKEIVLKDCKNNGCRLIKEEKI
jgi:hypothetical protein